MTKSDFSGWNEIDGGWVPGNHECLGVKMTNLKMCYACNSMFVNTNETRCASCGSELHEQKV